jgi:uncharacterized membrane protein YidH (DUF202 family)
MAHILVAEEESALRTIFSAVVESEGHHLARGSVRGVVLLVIGGILMIVGALRLLGFLSGRRSRLPPAVEGILILLLGAAVVVVGIVVMNR